MVQCQADQRLDIAIVAPERRFEQFTRVTIAAQRRGLIEDVPAALGQVYGVHVVRPLALRPAAFCGNELDADEGRRAERERPNNMDAVDLAMRGWAILNQPLSLRRD